MTLLNYSVNSTVQDVTIIKLYLFTTLISLKHSAYLVLCYKVGISGISRPIRVIKKEFLLEFTRLIAFQSYLTIQLKWKKKIINYFLFDCKFKEPQEFRQLSIESNDRPLQGWGGAGLPFPPALVLCTYQRPSGGGGGVNPGNTRAFAQWHKQIPPTQKQYFSTKSYHCPYPRDTCNSWNSNRRSLKPKSTYFEEPPKFS